MTDHGSPPADRGHDPVANGHRPVEDRTVHEQRNQGWAEGMSPVAGRPDLGRFLPQRSQSLSATRPAYEESADHERHVGYPQGPAGPMDPDLQDDEYVELELGDEGDPEQGYEGPYSDSAYSDSAYPDSAYSDEPYPDGPHSDSNGEPADPDPHPDDEVARPRSFDFGSSGEVAVTATGPPPPDNDAPELRQIAGLTAGTIIPLDRPSLAFAEGENEVGFRLDVAPSGRVEVIPEAATVTIDAVPVTGPTAVGLGALDVGSARFVVRPRFRSVGDWPDDRELASVEPAIIEVPAELAASDGTERNRRRRRLLGGPTEPARETLDAASWEFVETIRETRGETAERLRLLHPDPADLGDRARYNAGSLGFRRRGEARFAEVGVLCADISWMPRFDDITAIPESLGDHLRPLMSLPSVPIVADLLIGPLGITGPRRAAIACARHIALSLYGMSSDELMLHVVTDPGRADDWRWAAALAPDQRIDPRFGYPVLLVDGAHNFPGRTGLDHYRIMEGRAGLVVLADAVEQLPSYCGTVLQVDRAGSGLLTNHKGQVIKGTPIGVSAALAQDLAQVLVHVLSRRR